MQILKTSEILPEEGKYVLIHCGNSPWSDSDDNEGLFWKVAKFEKGISLKEREKLSCSSNQKDIDRSRMIYQEDEHGNNEKPYYWNEFGPGSYFGQEIKYWVELPDINEVI